MYDDLYDDEPMHNPNLFVTAAESHVGGYLLAENGDLLLLQNGDNLFI